MSPRAYFARHPVFTHEEFVRAHPSAGRSEHTSNAALTQAVEVGRLVRIRRGLYASVAPDCAPDADQPDADQPDPYLVASKLQPDAVRVDFVLEQQGDPWMVEDKHLSALAKHAPKQARYLDGRREPGRLVKPWNLIVPERVLEHRWEEPVGGP